MSYCWGLSYILSCVCHMLCCQCLETLMSRQMDMQLFLADGCKEALLEEKRRFCFLVDKHCMFSYQTASFHDKVQSIIMPSLIYSFCGCGGVKASDLFNTAATTYSAASGGTICYHGDGKTLHWFHTLSFIVFNAGTGQRHSDGKAEQLAGPVHRCHWNARQRPDDDWGAAHHCSRHTSTLALPITAQCGMRTITFTFLEYGLQTSVPLACWCVVTRSCGAVTH